VRAKDITTLALALLAGAVITYLLHPSDFKVFFGFGARAISLPQPLTSGILLLLSLAIGLFAFKMHRDGGKP
jgi:hypothetical protein